MAGSSATVRRPFAVLGVPHAIPGEPLRWTSVVMSVGTAFFHCRGEQVQTGTLAGVGFGTQVNRVKLTCDLVLGECEGFLVSESGTGDLAGIRTVTRSHNRLGEEFGTYESRTVVRGR